MPVSKNNLTYWLLVAVGVVAFLPSHALASTQVPFTHVDNYGYDPSFPNQARLQINLGLLPGFSDLGTTTGIRYRGSYPDTSTVQEDFSNNTSWTLSCGWTTCSDFPQSSDPDGNYWVLYQDTAGGDVYASYTKTGSQMTDNATANNSNTTHIINVSSPVLYSTTTSPVSVAFTYYVSSSTVPNGYTITYVNTLSHATKQYIGSLTSGFSGPGVYGQSTSTPLSGDGTWKMTISLIDWSPDVPVIPYTVISTAPDQWFGLNYNDNVQTVTFDGCADTTEASTTCSISFSGTFNLNQCVSYLVHPSCNTLDKFKSLTLAHSFPFAYAYQIGSLRNALLTATNTASTSIGVTIPWLGGHQQLTFLSASMINAIPYTPWIKNILSLLMLFMVAELIYYKVLRSHDEKTV